MQGRTFIAQAEVFHLGLSSPITGDMLFPWCHRSRRGPKIAKLVIKIHLDRAKLSQQARVMWIYHIPLQGYLKSQDPPSNVELETSA